MSSVSEVFAALSRARAQAPDDAESGAAVLAFNVHASSPGVTRDEFGAAFASIEAAASRSSEADRALQRTRSALVAYKQAEASMAAKVRDVEAYNALTFRWRVGAGVAVATPVVVGVLATLFDVFAQVVAFVGAGPLVALFALGSFCYALPYVWRPSGLPEAREELVQARAEYVRAVRESAAYISKGFDMRLAEPVRKSGVSLRGR